MKTSRYAHPSVQSQCSEQTDEQRLATLTKESSHLETSIKRYKLQQYRLNAVKSTEETTELDEQKERLVLELRRLWGRAACFQRIKIMDVSSEPAKFWSDEEETELRFRPVEDARKALATSGENLRSSKERRDGLGHKIKGAEAVFTTVNPLRKLTLARYRSFLGAH